MSEQIANQKQSDYRKRILIIINGCIASGKSTMARKLASSLRPRNLQVATIDLDLIYEILAPNPKNNESTWTQARKAAAAFADALFLQGMDLVIIEGAFWTKRERDELKVQAVSEEFSVQFVSLDVSFEEGLSRAKGDSTRGLSKQEDFLRAHYQEWRTILSNLPLTDLLLDTTSATPDELVSRITSYIEL